MPVIWAVLLVIRLVTATSGARTPTATQSLSMGPAAYGRLLLAFVGFGTVTVAAFDVAAVLTAPGPATIIPLVGATAALGALSLWLFFPWQLVRRFSRTSTPRLVYWVSRISLVFAFTNETRATAILLAAITAAHRGHAPKELRKWLWELLRTERSDRGTFGAAYGVLEALEAAAARKRGKLEKAHQHAERSRWLLGTITYMSPRALPWPVLSLVYELLDLDSIERGVWGALNTPEPHLTNLTRGVRDWTAVRLREDGDAVAAEKSRKRAGSTFLEDLYARPREIDIPKDASAARSRACHDYLKLTRGEPVSPRAAMNLLVTFDLLLLPESRDTVVPAQLRSDDEMVESIQEDVAESLTQALYRSAAVPVHALEHPGPISSRVYAKLENLLLADLERELVAMIDSNKFGVAMRDDAMTEWLAAARARGLYRRVQFVLGDAAAARVWPRLMFAYCNFGVKLSETLPRRRPLAYAVFNCLHGEALRFQDLDRVELLTRNKNATANTA